MYGLMVVDFCLVIMTDIQKSMFKQFGDNIIAVDGTHGLNNYDFELTSILVVDEFGEGIPVAFMFTNRKDTYIYQFFLILYLNRHFVSKNIYDRYCFNILQCLELHHGASRTPAFLLLAC